MGFLDIANRYAGLDAKNDPLAKIDEVVPWEDLRSRLEAAWRKLPDDVIFVEDLPHTATGKISKVRLRQRLKDYRLPAE